MDPAIDPEHNYCPRCGDEYRADIETCAACGIGLLRGAHLLARQAEQRQASRSLAIEPGAPVVTVHKGPLLQIKALQATLQDRGLPSLVATEDGAACGCRGAELLLQVRESDLSEVMAALAEEYRRSTGLADHDTRFAGAVYNTEEAEAVCPACGCRFATSLAACPDCGLCFA